MASKRALTTQARRVAAPIGRPLRRAAAGVRTRHWPAHSRLFVTRDAADWVLAYEARHLERIAASLGIQLGSGRWARGVGNQSIFHESQFMLLLHDFEVRGNNIGFAYFHGRPGTAGMPEFDACYESFRRRHRDIARVQVTNRAVEELVLEAGIAPEKVHLIPIGVDLSAFRLRSHDTKAAARRELGVPATAFVVGSFQKDGVGWGEGLEPKLIKGPDVLLRVAGQLKERIPELHFALTGPARGYVRAGLDRLGVPFSHFRLPDVDAVSRVYEAIDVCLVSSRDEGGPRAVLEAMATGVPLVTTRVGQAPELVRHGENGWLVEIEDVEGLVEWTAGVASAPEADLRRVVSAGRTTAEQNSYAALRERWRRLLDSFVAMTEPAG